MITFQDMLGFLKKFHSGEFSSLTHSSGITINGPRGIVCIFVSLGKERPYQALSSATV